jgi:hypothetical protein
VFFSLLGLLIYMFCVFFYWNSCVCVCVCEREREREESVVTKFSLVVVV